MRTRDPEKQKKIKEATVRLILREGINGASVAKIAREAEVSPATIYVYYDSKESMLSEIFQEYSDQSYRYLLRRVDPSMDGAAVIESLVRGYYDYTLEHQEVYSFVEQCSRCPGLAEYVSEPDCCCGVFDVLHSYQKRGELKAYSDLGLAAVLFAGPVPGEKQRLCAERADAAGRTGRHAAGSAAHPLIFWKGHQS